MSRLKTLLSKLPPLVIPAQGGINLYEFTLFPKLPPEIRDMIWCVAALEPRRIKLLVRGGNQAAISENLDVAGQQRHPGILHACRESRAVGLKVYEKCSVSDTRRLMGRGNLL